MQQVLQRRLQYAIKQTTPSAAEVNLAELWERSGLNCILDIGIEQHCLHNIMTALILQPYTNSQVSLSPKHGLVFTFVRYLLLCTN